MCEIINKLQSYQYPQNILQTFPPNQYISVSKLVGKRLQWITSGISIEVPQAVQSQIYTNIGYKKDKSHDVIK